MHFILNFKVEIILPLKRRKVWNYFNKLTDSACGLKIPLAMRDTQLLRRTGSNKKKCVGARILMCTSHTILQRQVPNLKCCCTKVHIRLHDASSVTLNHLKRKQQGANQETHQSSFPELPRKGETASGSVNSALCTETTASGFLGTLGLFSLTFCFSF